jgi:hypothetical protein
MDHGFDRGGLAAKGDVYPVGTVGRWVAARGRWIHGWVSLILGEEDPKTAATPNALQNRVACKIEQAAMLLTQRGG